MRFYDLPFENYLVRRFAKLSYFYWKLLFCVVQSLQLRCLLQEREKHKEDVLEKVDALTSNSESLRRELKRVEQEKKQLLQTFSLKGHLTPNTVRHFRLILCILV